MVGPVTVFELPATRTDRLAEGPRVAHLRRKDYGVADTASCRLGNWCHRVTPLRAPWLIGLPTCFAWWATEHAGKGVSRAYVAFETDPWDAPGPPPGPPAAEANLTRELEHLIPWRPPPGAIALRPLRSDADWEALQAFTVRAQGWEEDPGGQGYAAWSLQARRAGVERRGTQLGAFAGGRLVGGAALLEDTVEARYQEVVVDAEFRGRGIATALVGTLAQEARSRRPSLPIWITARNGRQADRIYNRLGFAPRTMSWCWAMDAPLSEPEIRRRWTLLQTAAIPMEQWHHRDHLWAAVCVLGEHGGQVRPALDALRAIIGRLLDALGVEATESSGYHETLTRGFLAVVAQQRSAHPKDSLVEATIRAQLAFGDKRYLLKHWSRDRMMSPEARAGWVPPDLEPLPTAHWQSM